MHGENLGNTLRKFCNQLLLIGKNIAHRLTRFDFLTRLIYLSQNVEFFCWKKFKFLEINIDNIKESNYMYFSLKVEPIGGQVFEVNDVYYWWALCFTNNMRIDIKQMKYDTGRYWHLSQNYTSKPRVQNTRSCYVPATDNTDTLERDVKPTTRESVTAVDWPPCRYWAPTVPALLQLHQHYICMTWCGMMWQR